MESTKLRQKLREGQLRVESVSMIAKLIQYGMAAETRNLVKLAKRCAGMWLDQLGLLTWLS